MAASTTEIRGLTGLRGAAAAFVALYHSSRFVTEPNIHQALHRGYLSVDLFFALSGFIMASTYADDLSPGFAAQAYGGFLWRRVARIWPLYVVAVAIAIVATIGAGDAPPDLATVVLPNLLMVQGWGVAASIDPPLWSVSVEFVAYLAFPALLGLALRQGWRGLGLTYACAIAAILGTTALAAANGAPRMGPLDVYDSGLLAIARCVAGFTMGVVVWRLSTMPRVAALASTSAAGIACAAAVAALYALKAPDEAIQALMPALVLCLARDRGALSAVMSWRPIHVLGLLSFAVYALQAPYFDLAEPLVARLSSHLTGRASTIAYYAALYGGLVAAAALAHHLVEKPSRRLLRRLGRKRTARMAA